MYNGATRTTPTPATSHRHRRNSQQRGNWPGCADGASRHGGELAHCPPDPTGPGGWWKGQRRPAGTAAVPRARGTAPNCLDVTHLMGGRRHRATWFPGPSERQYCVHRAPHVAGVATCEHRALGSSRRRARMVELASSTRSRICERRCVALCADQGSNLDLLIKSPALGGHHGAPPRSFGHHHEQGVPARTRGDPQTLHGGCTGGARTQWHGGLRVSPRTSTRGTITQLRAPSRGGLLARTPRCL